MGARKITDLNLANPIPAGRHCKTRVFFEMPLKLRLDKLCVVKRGYVAGYSPERAYEAQLRQHHIYSSAESSSLHVSQCNLGLFLHLTQRIAGDQPGRNQIGVTESHKSHVAGFPRGAVCESQQVNAGAHMISPRIDSHGEVVVDASPKAIEAILLQKINPELAEPQPTTIISEPCLQNHPEIYVPKT